MATRVFVSYAQVPSSHKVAVAELVASLQTAGLETVFDGDVQTPQGPPEGWPRWTLDQIQAADWVLVVSNEAYYRRFRGKETNGHGLGARWEGAVIQQELYTHGTLNRKFIPVLLHEGKEEHIPEPLRGATFYRCPAELPRLLAALSGQPHETKSKAAPSQVVQTASEKRNSRPNAPTRAAVPGRGDDADSRPDGLGTQPRPMPGPIQFALLSLGSFVCALLLVALWVWQAPSLAARGEADRLYYLVLVVLALAVAAFLFGTLRSFARYRGRQFGGMLELGGPIVAAALVVVGALLFPPKPGNFSLSVYVHGPGGPHQILSDFKGRVWVDFGQDRRVESVGDKGQAIFSEIPGSFFEQEVNVFVESRDYALVEPGRKYRLKDESLYLPVRRQAGRVAGRVRDYANQPVVGATVTVAGVSTQTGPEGRFEIEIAGTAGQSELSMDVAAPGLQSWTGLVTVNSNSVDILLQR